MANETTKTEATPSENKMKLNVNYVNFIADVKSRLGSMTQKELGSEYQKQVKTRSLKNIERVAGRTQRDELRQDLITACKTAGISVKEFEQTSEQVVEKILA